MMRSDLLTLSVCCILWASPALCNEVMNDDEDLADSLYDAIVNAQSQYSNRIPQSEEDDSMDIDLEPPSSRIWSRGFLLRRSCSPHEVCAKSFGRRKRNVCYCPQGWRCQPKNASPYSRSISYLCSQ